MSPHRRLPLLLAFALVAGLTTRATAQDDKPADLKPLEETLDKAFKAYNAGDAKAFFADYASSMKGIATEQTFKALYEDGAKKTFGKHVSRKLVKDKSALTGDFLLLVYDAAFEKEKKAKVSVNLQKEGPGYKIVQIQIEK